MPALAAILQRSPVIVHTLVLFVAIFGRWLFPYVLAGLFLATNIAFVCSQARMAYGMIRCYFGVRDHWRKDYWAIYQNGLRTAPPEALDTRYTPLTLPQIIIIPSYKEDVETLRQTLAILGSHPLAPYSYKVVLAMEEREAGAAFKGKKLAQEFSAQFLQIIVTLHPPNILGEVPGKGSNVRWAARWAIEQHSMELESQGCSPGMCDGILTAMDADTAFAADYFLDAAVRYLLAPPATRRQMMFVPPILFDRNQGEVPAVTRVTDIMWSTAGISGIYPSSTIKIPTSAYSMSLTLATHVGFWDAGPAAIGEDMHMFCKALFDTKGHLHVETIYSPASQCNVVGSVDASKDGRFAAFWSCCHARWAQAVRHMWGSLDTGYVFYRLLTGDFGVSDERVFANRLQRLEMRQAITKVNGYTNQIAATAAKNRPPTRFMCSDSDASSAATSDEEESMGFSGKVTRFGTREASEYSFTSNEDDEYQMEELPSLGRSSSEKSIPGSHKKVKIFPFLILVTRVYEAHLMLAHLVILINVLAIWPTISAFLHKQLALQTNAWGRSPLPVDGGQLGWATLALPWVHDDEIITVVTSICNKFGIFGAVASLITFVMHDLYHREAGKRWLTATRQPINGPIALPITPSPDQLELGTFETSGTPAPFNQFDLGMRPAPSSSRKLPWCLLDYLAVPGGLAFGVAPLVYAQVCHIWTDKLAYKVSAKPQATR